MNIPYLMAFTLINGFDSSGIYGGIFHYAQVFTIVGSSLVAFLYFWHKGRLDMDEEPKMQMMHDEDKENIHDC